MTNGKVWGSEFLTEIADAFGRIRSNAVSCAPLESYHGRYDVRRCLLNRFPYLVIFDNRPEEVLVVAIAHVRRRPLYWLDRLV